MIPLANHLWQSTLFAAAAYLVTLALRRNHARVRHAIWMAASVKFLIPFSLLVSVGSRFEWRTAAAAVPPGISPALDQITQPFTSIGMPAAIHEPAWPMVLAGLWIAGCAAILARWLVRWHGLHTMLRNAKPLRREHGIRIVFSSSNLEPGAFGIFRPVLVLPEDIAARLSPEQLTAVIAHELCHVRRRDNLAAAFHMLVEAIFWFHPLVWWIGARLVDERERACDEEVLRLGNQPQAYAEGILNVCKLYMQSPLVCASGVTGSDLKKRIEAIMMHRISPDLSLGRKLILFAAGMAAVAGPVWIGIGNMPRVLAQSLEHNLTFEVASIKSSDPNSRGMRFELIPGGGLRTAGASLRTLIEFAYDVRSFQLSGGPGWIHSERYDIMAKPNRSEGPADLDKASHAEQLRATDQLRERIRSLLADRFRLTVHKEAKELPVYLLVAGKNGSKLQEATEAGDGITRNRGIISSQRATVERLAFLLSSVLARPVLDRTGLKSDYKYKLEWTEESAAGGEKIDDGITNPNPVDPQKPSIFTAIQEQLGLKLEAAKGPVDIIVIDRAEKPSEN